MRRKIFTIIFIINSAFISLVYSQQFSSVSLYIDEYKDVSIKHMKEYGIPASIKLAQAILESSFGNSELAVNANNHFGIKCHGWRYATYYKDDDEKDECFRSYRDPLSSFDDHSEFLTTRDRYSFLFDFDPLDYKRWALGLREAGYATNPKYPQLLIRIIEKHELYKYDIMAAKSDKLTSSPSRPLSPQFTAQKREVKLNNNIEYVYAKEGETPEAIAEKMDMWAWQIYNYNELDHGANFDQGDIVYLQPKRRRSQINHHIVRDGETMYEISQIYGVRLDRLYRRNNMTPDSVPDAGQKILLRGRARN